MNRKYLAATVIVAGLGTLSVQVFGLISLKVTDFGLFSLVYLLSAFGQSFQLSFLSEAWVRVGVIEDERESVRYNTVGFYLALFFSLCTALMSVFISQLNEYWWLAWIAVISSIYRSGARYAAMRHSCWKKVLVGDATHASVALIGGAISFVFFRGSLGAIFTMWAAAAFLSALTYFKPGIGSPKVIINWYVEKKNTIKILLKDSLILDLSSIGTPYVLAPILGLSNFGVYRAVSNTSAPVRLILSAIRPRISTLPRHKLTQSATSFSIFTASMVFGSGAYVALLGIDYYDLDLGALSALSAFALPVGLFVSSNLVAHFYSIVARNFSRSKYILTGRINQTILTSVSPIIGAVYWGLNGAIWFYSLSTLLSAVVWFFVNFYSAKD